MYNAEQTFDLLDRVISESGPDTVVDYCTYFDQLNRVHVTGARDVDFHQPRCIVGKAFVTCGYTPEEFNSDLNMMGVTNLSHHLLAWPFDGDATEILQLAQAWQDGNVDVDDEMAEGIPQELVRELSSDWYEGGIYYVQSSKNWGDALKYARWKYEKEIKNA